MSRVEPISVTEYAAAVQAAIALPFGEELIGLLRDLDRYVQAVDLGDTLRDGGRTARVHSAYAALVRALAKGEDR